jgi:serine/threonine-protein kinase
MATSTGYLTGSTRGRLRVGPLLGRGGMGEVYGAEDAELGRQVALKVLPESLPGDEERLVRFTQEARTTSALNHPHIVEIYDIGRQVPAGAAHGWLTHRAAPARGLPLQMTRMTRSGNVSDAAISPDGRYVAYLESAGGRQSLWYRQILIANFT